jgi:hypothetical protein
MRTIFVLILTMIGLYYTIPFLMGLDAVQLFGGLFVLALAAFAVRLVFLTLDSMTTFRRD